VALKRVIPCLDVDRGRVVKGTNFVDIRDAGDPVELAERYDQEGADELIFLDITASHEKRDTIVELARRTADNVFIPFTIGGGIRSVADAQAVLDAGADKVSVNSAAVARPDLISEMAPVFGDQCVVLAIDARRRDDGAGWEVVAGVVFHLAWGAVVLAKGKVRLAAIGFILAPIYPVAAIRLARPGSPWARRFYKPGSAKLAKAAARARRWDARRERWLDWIGGAPHLERAPRAIEPAAEEDSSRTAS